MLGSSPTNACTHVQVCGSNGSAAMLAANRSTGVTPEVNLRNTLPVGNEAYKRGIILALKSRADIIKIPKQGCQWPHKRTNVLYIKYSEWSEVKLFPEINKQVLNYRSGTRPSGVRWICTWQCKVFYHVVFGSPGTPFRGRICLIMQTMVVNISESITCF